MFLVRLKVVAGPLQKSELKHSVVKKKVLAGWKCLPLLVTYCCGNTESKNISGIRHGIPMNRPCARGMVTKKKFSNLRWPVRGQ